MSLAADASPFGGQPRKIRAKRVLPGFTLSLGTTLLYLTLIVLIPVLALILRGSEVGFDRFIAIITSRRAAAAFRFTLTSAAIATFINAFYGLLIAWVLVRYEFWGKRFLDALIDVPFALPTAVAGLALVSLLGPNGWFGAILYPLGIPVIFTMSGVVIAMAFTSIPFVVRSVQPVLEDLDPALEQAATTLGATPFTIFRRVILPAILPAWLAGITISFARSIGEFGAVVFIAGNRQGQTEIASLLAYIRLEMDDYNGAAAIALALLLIALVLLIVSNLLQFWSQRYREPK